MTYLTKHIAPISLIAIATPVAGQIAADGTDPQSARAAESRTIAVLPLEVLTDRPKGAEVGQAAFERTLSTLASVEGINVLGPETTSSYADSGRSRDELDAIAEELGAAAIVTANVTAQGETFSFDVSLRRAGDTNDTGGYGAPIGFVNPGTKITIWSSDGQPMSLDFDAFLASRLADLVDDVRELFFPGSVAPPEPVATNHREIFLDTTLSLRERMDAFQVLASERGAGRFRGIEAEPLDADVTAAALDLATTTDNGHVRALLWQQMAGIGDPIFVAPLLQTLAADPDQDVRLQVAKVLQQDFLEEPGVREALSYAMTSDPSATVRKQISFSMLDAAGQTESLKATVLNTSLSAWDRTYAFSQLLGEEWDAPNDIDPEIVDAMVDVTLNTPTPRARVFALNSLVQSRHDDPRFLDLYLTALERDRDETVRQTAVSGLAQFLDDPAIREALEQAMVNDSSPQIRKTIAETLRWDEERNPAAAAATITNPAATDRDKVAAWGMIHASAADYWTDSIVTEMTRIGMTSADPNVRADIWRSARAGRTHPLLLQPLLQALASDLDGNVRVAAARTLDQYLDDPGVREALQSAAQYDPDAAVRARAAASLASQQSDL